MRAALAKHKALAAKFDALAPSHKREYVKWIEEAKRLETRQKRISATIERLAKSR